MYFITAAYSFLVFSVLYILCEGDLQTRLTRKVLLYILTSHRYTTSAHLLLHLCLNKEVKKSSYNLIKGTIKWKTHPKDFQVTLWYSGKTTSYNTKKRVGLLNNSYFEEYLKGHLEQTHHQFSFLQQWHVNNCTPIIWRHLCGDLKKNCICLYKCTRTEKVFISLRASPPNPISLILSIWTNFL